MAAGDGLAPDAPFVLTLEMDGDTFSRLNELRRRFYPPERNLVPAHVTLFHQLPGGRGREIKALLRQIATSRQAIEVEAIQTKSLGSGVAVFLRSPQLNSLREGLAAEWWPWLSDQDKAGFRPHVTIQNKVSAAEARRTEREVAATRIGRVRGIGLHLWRYRDGPWEDVQLFRFR